MGKKFQFVKNFHDLSNNRGFQFEFYCDRCGTGYRSKFKPSATGTVSELLDGASSIFGGIFGRTASIGDQIHSATWQKARDNAFEEAQQELIADFIQCPRCSSWVCREKCWNNSKGLCKNCAPDLGVEMSAAQSNRSVEEIWAHASMAEEDKHLSQENWREVIKASCPNCGAPMAKNSKFCPECGQRLTTDKFCSECGDKVPENAKFCNKCGTKL